MPRPIRKRSLLNDNELRQDRTSIMTGIFAEADTVLTGTKVNVEMASSGPAPGWSTHGTIYMNAQQVDMSTMDGVIEATGLNYHEIGHVMYTPHEYTNVGQQVARMGWRFAFNLLEDIRLESILTTLYPATVPYFKAMMAKWILNTPQAKRETLFPLVYGRRYLAPQIRKSLRESYLHQNDIPDLVAIIDAYRTIAFPRDEQKAIKLIEAFHKILVSQPPVQDPYNHKQSNHKHGGATEDSKAQEEASDAVQKATEQQDAEEAESESQGSGAGDDEPDDEQDGSDGSDGSGQGQDDPDDLDGEGPGQGEGQGPTESQPGDTDGEDGQDGSGQSDDGQSMGDESGNGAGSKENAPEPKDLDEALHREFDDALNDDLTKAQANDIKRKIDRGTPQVEKLGNRRYRMVPVSTDSLGASRRLGTQLQRLVADTDPGWEPYKQSGRLNMQRVLDGSPVQEMFDQWYPGKNDAMSVEVVILLDVSVSMEDLLGDAGETMWAIKRAFDQIGANTTVLAYGSTDNYLYRRGERADHNTYRFPTQTDGSTDPEGALTEARRLLHYSDKHVKYLFIVTDGEWTGFSVDRCNKQIEWMNEAGVITSLLYVDEPADVAAMKTMNPKLAAFNKRYRHNAQIFHAVSDIHSLVDMAKQLVKVTVASFNR